MRPLWRLLSVFAFAASTVLPATAQTLSFDQARLCVQLGSAINDFQLAIAGVEGPILAGRTTDVGFAPRIQTLRAAATRFDQLFEEARFLLPHSVIEAAAVSGGVILGTAPSFGNLETAWSIADLEVGQTVALHARGADLSAPGARLRDLADLLGNPLALQQTCSALYLVDGS